MCRGGVPLCIHGNLLGGESLSGTPQFPSEPAPSREFILPGGAGGRHHGKLPLFAPRGMLAVQLLYILV